MTPTIETIIELTAHAMNVAPSDIVGPRRFAPLVDARFMAVHVCRRNGHTLNEIGRALGNRDHSSIIHAERTFIDRAEQNPDFRSKALKIHRWTKHWRDR